MYLKPKVYEHLENTWEGYSVTLEDIVRNDCTYQHYLRYIGQEPDKKKRGPSIVVDNLESGMKALVSKYLKDCYGDRLETANKSTVNDFIDAEIVGCIEDSLIDVAVLPAGGFESTVKTGKLPTWVIALASTKAYLMKKKKAFIIIMNRNNQKWASYSITGDLSIVAKEVLEDVKELQSRIDNKIDHLGRDSDCFRCSFARTCAAKKQQAKLPYTVKYTKVAPSANLCLAVDKYLFSLNNEKTGRATHCIHPSEFSVYACDRRIAYSLMGTKRHNNISPHLRRIFDVGHICHDIIQNALTETMPDDCEIEVPVHHEQYKIKGHCDGVYKDNIGRRNGIEIKSISSKGFEKLSSAKKDHQKQGTLYGTPLDLHTMNYLYMNKDTGNIKEFEAPVSKNMWHNLAARAESILRDVKKDVMPERIDKDYLCKQCPFMWTCRPGLRRSA
ncbi:MAG: hypothetical protein VXZ72_00885 [Chlamydiota bacterium]|nr:hypothetical protein [Chlamydiota bacterium]